MKEGYPQVMRWHEKNVPFPYIVRVCSVSWAVFDDAGDLCGIYSWGGVVGRIGSAAGWRVADWEEFEQWLASRYAAACRE